VNLFIFLPPRKKISHTPPGWDGKPIPYWLYKLHGLGVEYKCEICGNASYWGRKAYEKHFQEWRHAHGMRCLGKKISKQFPIFSGIPNTRHFLDITKINDAVALWQKLRRDATEKVQISGNYRLIDRYGDLKWKRNTKIKKEMFIIKRLMKI
jgi:hypothetical protein